MKPLNLKTNKEMKVTIDGQSAEVERTTILQAALHDGW
jgi:hypothetical protein